jgi:AcrR family transcriptional regulator
MDVDMKPNERRQRDREEFRARILDAARELFATSGYEAVTMRRIAERIEYTPMAIYSYFRDKDALLRALCDADFAALRTALARVARAADPIARLRRMGRAYADFAEGHPNHYRLMFMSPPPWPAPGSSGAGAEGGGPERDTYSAIKAAVEAALSAGRFRPELRDADLLTQTIWGGVHGVIALHLALGGDPWVDWRPAKKSVRLMIDALIRGLTIEGEQV